MSRTAVLLALVLAFFAASCDKVALLAPTQSTISLSVNTTTIASDGTVQVAATVIEQAGTPVHNGTTVTFTATVGVMDPPEARTQDGIARSTFRANGTSGRANLSAFSGGAKTTAPVEILVGSAAAETVRLRVDPSSVPQTGGTVQVIATVLDVSGNPIPLVPVTFSTDGGTLGATAATTNQAGEARTTLLTNRATVVVATVAGRPPVEAKIAVINSPTVALALSGTASPTVGVPFTVTVTPTAGGNPTRDVIVDFGDGSTPRNLGAITGATGVQHTYIRADTYNIRATITDINGVSGTASLPVAVTRSLFSVTITGTPNPANTGEQVTFTVSIQPAPNGPPITGGTVTFSDGTPAQPLGSATAQTFQRSFSTAGMKVATVRVSDAAGTEAQNETRIEVRPRAALEVTLDGASADSNFTVSCLPTSGYPKTCTATPNPLSPTAAAQPTVRVQFTTTVNGLATGDSVVQFVWDWGDGAAPETTTARFNDHTFARGTVTFPGVVASRTYTVTVAIRTATGATGSSRLTLILN